MTMSLLTSIPLPQLIRLGSSFPQETNTAETMQLESGTSNLQDRMPLEDRFTSEIPDQNQGG